MVVRLLVFDKNFAPQKQIFCMNDKVALITGAAGLLGPQHAVALLKSGSKVILTDVDEAALNLLKERLANDFISDNVKTFVMDVTSERSINGCLKDIKNLGLRLDVLINNAAVNPKVEGQDSLSDLSRLENFELKQWEKEISVGLTGAFLCSKIFGAEMSKDGLGGVILNISSDLSVIAPDQRLYSKASLDPSEQPVKPVTYSVVKTGIIGLTRYLASYWSGRNIRCNALSPGGVYNNQDSDFVSRIESSILLGRMASNDDYIGAIQFLCSDASAYMTGQNIVMDGGRSVI